MTRVEGFQTFNWRRVDQRAVHESLLARARLTRVRMPVASECGNCRHGNSSALLIAERKLISCVENQFRSLNLCIGD